MVVLRDQHHLSLLGSSQPRSIYVAWGGYVDLFQNLRIVWHTMGCRHSAEPAKTGLFFLVFRKQTPFSLLPIRCLDGSVSKEGRVHSSSSASVRHAGGTTAWILPPPSGIRIRCSRGMKQPRRTVYPSWHPRQADSQELLTRYGRQENPILGGFYPPAKDARTPGGPVHLNKATMPGRCGPNLSLRCVISPVFYMTQKLPHTSRPPCGG
ncbi:hypothetical protein GQ53DRAFT_339000 [Thozetella sp. PMI_491]|nr:hypothetical protein GQ53DRAFT_339000 [Thozetella sp. PMI_491]